MTRSIDIFVKDDRPVRELAEELESLLKITLSAIEGIQETYYQFNNQKVEMTLGEHSFDNDKEMNFENYSYHISVRALNIGTGEDRMKWCNEFAGFVFKQLKINQKNQLMLVDDLQVKLEEFYPQNQL